MAEWTGPSTLDNVTHSLVGIALADLTLRGSSKGERRLAAGAALVAANLPDIDIAYSAMTPPPLGYLLHHRGHTHTVLGAVLLTAALVMAYRQLPALRKWRMGDRLRLWLLIAVALASHLLLDALNSYGMHPFYPVNSTWYYGDAVFIFEPCLWMLLAIPVALNARTRRPRVAAIVPILIFPVVMAFTGILSIESVVLLALVGVGFALLTKRISPRARAAAALAASLLVVGGFLFASGIARRTAVPLLRAHIHGQLVDVALTPNPSSPICWAVIGVERNDSNGEYVLWRGTLSLQPAWKSPATCASHRFAISSRTRVIGRGELVLTDEIHQPLGRLQELARTDCWVRAWLRFGRAPVIERGAIFDLRFAQRVGPRFTYMPIGASRTREGCPAYVPGWGMPRADLISR